MATAAEPRPASLPLPGGRDGATVRLHPLLTGRAIAPEAFLRRPGGRMAWRQALGIGVPRERWVDMPIPAFLVEHPGAGPVLIDTGLHPSCAVKPAQSLGRLGSMAFKDLQMRPEQAVPAQLRERGVEPGSVGVVVMTHLHIDHASGMSELPEPTFVFSRAEWEAATSQGPLHGYRRRQFDHAFDYRTLDFEGPDTSSLSGFGRSLDLFGDGSVRLVSTPGHTLGHLSAVLRLTRRDALVAGDAIYLRSTLEEGHLPYRIEDGHLFRRSLHEMQLYVREARDALVIPGHDWEAWRELEPVYE